MRIVFIVVVVFGGGGGFVERLRLTDPPGIKSPLALIMPNLDNIPNELSHRFDSPDC